MTLEEFALIEKIISVKIGDLWERAFDRGQAATFNAEEVAKL